MARTFVALAALVATAGCATEDQVKYGDPTRLTGAGGGGTTTSGSCVPDAACTTSFKTDVFGAILDGKAKCGDASCHATEVLGFQLVSGDSSASYAKLMAYQLGGKAPYVVPCDPGASKMLCNMKLGDDAGANTYGACGSLMPKLGVGTALAEPLAQSDLTTIAEWIACGAPEN